MAKILSAGVSRLPLSISSLFGFRDSDFGFGPRPASLDSVEPEESTTGTVEPPMVLKSSVSVALIASPASDLYRGGCQE